MQAAASLHDVAPSSPLSYEFAVLGSRLRRLTRDEPDPARAAACAAASAQITAVHARLTADLVLIEREPHSRAMLTEALSPLAVGELHIDRSARVVRVGAAEIALTPREYSILCVLASDHERLFTKQELYTAVWRSTYSPSYARTLDSHTSRLRVKLGGQPWVETIRGVGYRLRPLAPQLAVVGTQR
jgi:DNA-binding response OmpR family regulator